MATKTALQEQILQLDGSIYYPEGHDKEGKELTVDDLKTAIDIAREAALAAHVVEEEAKAEARRPLPEEPEPELELEEQADEPKVTKSRKSGGRKRAVVAPVRDPPADILKKNNVTVSEADRKMARKHGYPVAVPGGKAYKISVSMNCIFGAGLRQANSIVILDEVEADAKSDYLIAV